MKKKKQEEILSFIQCENRIFYAANPITENGEICLGGDMENFIRCMLYPMPETAKNHLCWKVRCDIVFADYWLNFPNKEKARQDVENSFWSTVKAIFNGVQGFYREFPTTITKERELGLKKEKTVYTWNECTYEIEGFGYDDCPLNPWLSTKERLALSGLRGFRRVDRKM